MEGFITKDEFRDLLEDENNDEDIEPLILKRFY